jgi:hypothetical protein
MSERRTGFVEAAEFNALKAERDKLKEWCRKLIEDGTFPGEAEALRAERDRLTIIADAIQAERDRLRAALEEIAKLYPGPLYNGGWLQMDAGEIARRALEEK